MDELTVPLRLGRGTLERIPGSIAAPTYPLEARSPGIVHIGVGNFHRAHMAWYLHQLMQQGDALDWAIVGAGVRDADAAMREKLLAQDCLTMLIELGPDGVSAEVTGAMMDFIPVEPGHSGLIDRMAEPATRIVSLTVTEGGYFLHPSTGAFTPADPDIQHDAAHPDAPRTVFGAIVAALARRRLAGTGPFTVLSCDNLRGNGDITRAAVTSLAELSDGDLAAWIDATCTFPNSMVDCIVPATGAAEIAQARALGVDDAAPVTHENFRQWVIEDVFCAGRPNWESVGATFTQRVHNYEAMKIRILNAGHQVLANAGEVLGIATIDACMADPDIAAFFSKVQRTEIVPHVDAVPGMTPLDYVALIGRRFANPAIRDTTRRVAFDGSSRHTGFVLPILLDAHSAGTPLEGLCLAEALWARMCFGIREDGSEIAANDPLWDALTDAAKRARTDPNVWLAQADVYGRLGTEPRIQDTFASWLEDIWAHGTRAALRKYTGAA